MSLIRNRQKFPECGQKASAGFILPRQQDFNYTELSFNRFIVSL